MRPGARASASAAAARTGRYAAWALAAVGGVYLVVLAYGMAVHGRDEPIGDPTLFVMEVLTLLAAPLVVLLVASLQAGAPAARRAHGAAALAFASIFAGLTGAVHFVELTARRQLGSSGIAWPSPAYAVELLAWNAVLGLALLLAAGLVGGAAGRAARRAVQLTGLLCVAGTVGPLVGDMRLQLVGVVGYAVVLPVACVLLARWLGRVAAAPDVPPARAATTVEVAG